MKITEKIFCAFCRHERKIYNKKHVSWTNIIISLLATTFVDIAFIGPISAKSIVVFVSLLCLAEIFVQIRWRMSLPCPYCSFDPMLYLHSKKRALEKVKARLDIAKNDEVLKFSSKNPLRNLPIMKVRPQGNSRQVKKSALNEKLNWTKETPNVNLESKGESDLLQASKPLEKDLPLTLN
jgi:hypothetical protein